MVDTKETNEYKDLLSVHLKETDGRSMYSSEEVRNILLDLWIALNADSQRPASN